MSHPWKILSAPQLEHLAQLVNADSFYLADVDLFQANLTELLAQLRARYPRSNLGYSYKTNYLPAFARLADDLGCWAEVVSRMELEYALSLGMRPERILFNGPVKRPADLAFAFDLGVTVIADSWSEIDDIMVLADGRLGAPTLRLALRCELPRSTPGTRFGIDLGAPDAADRLRRMREHEQIRLVGLHAHHSGDRSAARYAMRSQELITLHQEVLGGAELEFIDLGGGIGSTMPPELAAQLSYSAPSFAEYAQALTQPFLDAYGRDDGPDLILEPGMGVLANTTSFVTRVIRLKHTSSGAVAVLDGSLFNVKPLRSAVNLPVRVVAAGGTRHHGSWRFVGHTCMEIDILHEGYEGEIGEGDFVVMPNVGAYTTVLNAPFIRPLPPIITVDEHGAVHSGGRPLLGAPHLAATFGATDT